MQKDFHVRVYRFVNAHNTLRRYYGAHFLMLDINRGADEFLPSWLDHICQPDVTFAADDYMINDRLPTFISNRIPASVFNPEIDWEAILLQMVSDRAIGKHHLKPNKREEH